jgi:hypothetical protein
MQSFVITSPKVNFAKQGTVVLVDGEPESPTIDKYEAEEGWKMVRSVVVNGGGGDYRFPEDQILVCAPKSGKLTTIKSAEDRELRNLRPNKHYLVWYHHLWREGDLKMIKSTGKSKASKS